MKKNLKKQIIVTIFLILGIGAFTFGLFFLLRLLDQRLTRVLEIKEQIATYEINKNSFSEEAQEVKSLQLRFERLKSLVVTTTTLPTVLSNLETLSLEKKLELEITGVSTPLEEGKNKLRIDFTALGTFEDIDTFIETILKQPFVVSIVRLEMSIIPKIEPIPIDDPKKISPIVLSKEPTWRMLGTIEILSF